ncbi:MAG: hypothetical protein MZU97_09765 [Bacillus subtilis]|nr:hypothetical protein [Bacillus subtilis]
MSVEDVIAPAPPSVQTTNVTCAPDAASFAAVPPAPTSMSSGCGPTNIAFPMPFDLRNRSEHLQDRYAHFHHRLLYPSLYPFVRQM